MANRIKNSVKNTCGLGLNSNFDTIFGELYLNKSTTILIKEIEVKIIIPKETIEPVRV